MAFFVLQVPIKLKKPERELLELLDKASASKSEKHDDDNWEDNPVLDRVRLMLETHEAVGALTWMENDNQVLIMFAVTGEAMAERLMKDLVAYGIGAEYGNLSLVNLEAQFPKKVLGKKEESFMETVKSRVMVENVVQQTKAQAVFSFDFLCLCVVASILAAVGLASDSAVVVVASMLVSPIMGPILAVTFGSVVHDWKLVKVGVLSEMLSLLICVASGFFVGLCFAPYGSFFGWPTKEMAGRGTSHGILVGLAIAIPSGVGVALSVLGNNTSSLVGVAISASLLPPAVNCGMCFAYALVGGVWNEDVDRTQFINIGSISFFLTIVNIICVYCAAFVMYKVKEVVPLPGKTHFWAKDVALARNHAALVLDDEDSDLMRLELHRHLSRQQNARTMAPQSLSNLTMAAVPSSLSGLTWHPSQRVAKSAAEQRIEDLLGHVEKHSNGTANGPRKSTMKAPGSLDGRRTGSHVHFRRGSDDMPQEMAAMFKPPPKSPVSTEPPASLSLLFDQMSPRAAETDDEGSYDSTTTGTSSATSSEASSEAREGGIPMRSLNSEETSAEETSVSTESV